LTGRLKPLGHPSVIKSVRSSYSGFGVIS